MRAEERTLLDWLQDIESNAAKIIAYTADTDLAAFRADELVGDLVIVKFQNMGEAARYIVQYFPAYAATVPLPLAGMKLMRNRLAHGYFDINMDVLWEAAHDDVPGVLAQVRQLIAAEGKA